MLTLGVVTDAHFGPEARFDGKLRKLSSSARDLCADFVRKMRDQVRPDLLVNLGDLVEDESPDLDAERYGACLDELARGPWEIVSVAGNHDCVHLDARWLRRRWGLSADGPLHRSFDRGGYHFVVLHTREHRDVEVTIDVEQLAWLQADLAQSRLPTVVLMHHSAAEQDLAGNRWFARAPHICLVKERRALRRLLGENGRTLLVVNGHLHWNHFDLVEGIPYVTLQSLVENVADDAPGVAAAAHAVIQLHERRVVVDVAGVEPCRYQIER